MRPDAEHGRQATPDDHRPDSRDAAEPGAQGGADYVRRSNPRRALPAVRGERRRASRGTCCASSRGSVLRASRRRPPRAPSPRRLAPLTADGLELRRRAASCRSAYCATVRQRCLAELGHQQIGELVDELAAGEALAEHGVEALVERLDLQPREVLERLAQHLLARGEPVGRRAERNVRGLGHRTVRDRVDARRRRSAAGSSGGGAAGGRCRAAARHAGGWGWDRPPWGSPRQCLSRVGHLYCTIVQNLGGLARPHRTGGRRPRHRGRGRRRRHRPRAATRGARRRAAGAGSLGAPRGGSKGSARILRPAAYPDETYLEMGLRAVERWREIESRIGERILVSHRRADAPGGSRSASYRSSSRGCRGRTPRRRRRPSGGSASRRRPPRPAPSARRGGDPGRSRAQGPAASWRATRERNCGRGRGGGSPRAGDEQVVVRRRERHAGARERRSSPPARGAGPLLAAPAIDVPQATVSSADRRLPRARVGDIGASRGDRLRRR